ncbi:hypothetical protein ACFPIJ_36315 [Dactylosporangium cerinum]|uniref:Uncharacterized protein n=1 Tax=Dactylosporangium cerinum TaxID=1434730 RepID=A0ABV9W3R3_9ACTN
MKVSSTFRLRPAARCLKVDIEGASVAVGPRQVAQLGKLPPLGLPTGYGDSDAPVWVSGYLVEQRADEFDGFVVTDYEVWSRSTSDREFNVVVTCCHEQIVNRMRGSGLK